MSKYIPAVFQPTVRPSWVGILSYVSNEEKAQILEAILKYPQETDIKSKFWEETIKPDLETQYTKFTKSCEAKGCGSRTYWESKDKDNISLPNDNHKYNISISKDKVLKDKDKDKDKVNNRGNCKGGEEKYGSLKNVILEKEQYESLKEKYPNIDDAIEELDTWLGKNSKSAKEARGKNHYAYFKQNSWVWERVGEQRNPVESVSGEQTDGVLVEQGKFFIDDTMPEYHEACKNLTDDEQERAWKWIMEHFEGKRLTVDFINNVLKKFDTSTQFRQAQGF